MQPHDFLSQLSQHLPNAINGMTPNGRLPDEGLRVLERELDHEERLLPDRPR